MVYDSITVHFATNDVPQDETSHEPATNLNAQSIDSLFSINNSLVVNEYVLCQK